MRPVSLLLLLFVCSAGSYAQSLTQGQGTWYMYAGQFKTSAKWGIHLDIQFRAGRQKARVSQYLTRAGLQYYFSPAFNVTGGYAHIQTYNAGADAFATEHRSWEQFIANTAAGRFSGIHRFRLEQRFAERLKKDAAGRVSNDGFNTGHRIRYMYRALLNLSGNTERITILYLALQEEVFFNFSSPSINRNAFDQNRVMLGAGLFHKKHTRFEVGYLNQLVNPATGKNVMNHLLQVSVMQSLNFAE